MQGLRLLAISCFTLVLNACATTSSEVAVVEPVAREYMTIGDPAAFQADTTTVFITGANRGIGLEFINQLSQRGWNIIATSRKPDESADLAAIAADYPQLVIEELDVTDYDRVDGLAAKYANTPVDILISNAGITPKYVTAFKKVDGIDWDMARSSWEVNAIAPLKLAEAFLPVVSQSEQKKIVIISSKAGSFELSPKMPMMYSYRGSKAALNMYMYTLSFETNRKDIIVTMMSPGQVNTNPGFKLKGNIEPDESVSKMLKVIDGLTMANNGQFLDFEDGRVLAW